jgi:hypothetical protein
MSTNSMAKYEKQISVLWMIVSGKINYQGIFLQLLKNWEVEQKGSISRLPL